MKPQELKLRLETQAVKLLESILDNNSVTDRMKMAAAKFFIKQNLWRVDQVLEALTDKNGDIDTLALGELVEEALFDSDGRLTVKLRQVAPPAIESFVPDKIVILTREDLRKLLQ